MAAVVYRVAVVRTLVLVAVAVAVVGAAYGLGRRDGTLAADEAAATQAARAVLAAGAAYRSRLAELDAQADRAQARVQTLTTTVARQRTELTALRAALAAQTTPADTGTVATLARDLHLQPTSDGRWATDSVGVRQLAVTAWRSTVLLPAVERFADSLEVLVTALRAERVTWAERAAVAEARVAALEPALAGLVEARSCRILVFPCPSRTTSLVAGVALGALTVAVVR